MIPLRVQNRPLQQNRAEILPDQMLDAASLFSVNAPSWMFRPITGTFDIRQPSSVAY